MTGIRPAGVKAPRVRVRVRAYVRPSAGIA